MLKSVEKDLEKVDEIRASLDRINGLMSELRQLQADNQVEINRAKKFREDN